MSDRERGPRASPSLRFHQTCHILLAMRDVAPACDDETGSSEGALTVET